MFAQLHLIDVSKACGPDLITGFLLKRGAEVIASPLSYLFTKSMCTAALPRDWFTANAVPIFKHDDKSVVKNYHPINLTSLVVKAMESIIYSNLIIYYYYLCWSLMIRSAPVSMGSVRIVQLPTFWYRWFMIGQRH